MKFAILIIAASLLGARYAAAAPRHVRIPGWPNPRHPNNNVVTEAAGPIETGGPAKKEAKATHEMPKIGGISNEISPT